VKGERSCKKGHVAATVAVPARGPIMPVFWTFAGTDKRSRIQGTKSDFFQTTENGWPDDLSWVKWCEAFVAELKARGLTKALLFCDNASLHYHKAAIAILAAANVRVIGLIPGCTGWHQPLDVAFFGQLKAALTPLVHAAGAFLTDENLAFWVQETIKHLVKLQADKGKDPGESGFRKAGLYPFNVEVFPDESFRASDAFYGLSEDHPKVKEARALTPEAVGIVVNSMAAALKPNMAARLKKEGEEDLKKGGFDLGRIVFTDQSFAEKRAADEEAKRLEVEEKAKRKAERTDRAAANKAAKGAKSAAAAARR
jgi:hypothetical protein